MKMIKTKKQKNLTVVISLIITNIICFLLILSHYNFIIKDYNHNIEYMELEIEYKILNIIINKHNNLLNSNIIQFQTPEFHEESVISLNDNHFIISSYLSEISSNSVKILNYYDLNGYNLIKYIINNNYIGMIVINKKGDLIGNVILD